MCELVVTKLRFMKVPVLPETLVTSNVQLLKTLLAYFKRNTLTLLLIQSYCLF